MLIVLPRRAGDDDQILPFNSREAELFQLNPGSGRYAALLPQLYHLDHGVSAANYIDTLLPREERHHADAHHRCLLQIDRILRARQPYLEPRDMPEDDLLLKGKGLMVVGDWAEFEHRDRAFELRTMKPEDITLCKTGQLHALFNSMDEECLLFMFGGYD